MQALSKLRECWCSTRGIISGERGFVLFGECCCAVEEVTWFQEIKEIPHVEQTRFHRSTCTGDTQHARIKAFEGMGNFGAGGFIFLGFVSDDNRPVACHSGKRMLVVRDSFVVRQDNAILSEALQVQYRVANCGLSASGLGAPHSLQLCPV